MQLSNEYSSLKIIDVRGRLDILAELRANSTMIPSGSNKIICICGSEAAYEMMTSKDLMDNRLEFYYYGDIMVEDDYGNLVLRDDLFDLQDIETVVVVDVHKYTYNTFISLLNTFSVYSHISVISDSDLLYVDDTVKKIISGTDKSLFWTARNSSSLYNPDILFVTRNLIISKGIVKMLDLASEERKSDNFTIDIRYLNEIDYSELITYTHIVSYLANAESVNEDIRDILGYETVLPRVNEPMITRKGFNVYTELENELDERRLIYVPTNTIVTIKDIETVGGKCYIICENFKKDIFKIEMDVSYLTEFSIKPVGSDSVDLSPPATGVPMQYAYCISPYDMMGKCINSAVVLFNNDANIDIKYALYNIILGVKQTMKVITDMNYYLQ